VPTDFKTGWAPEAIWADNRGDRSVAGHRNRNTIPPLSPPPRHYTECVTPAPIRFPLTYGCSYLVLVELRFLLSWYDNRCPRCEVSELCTQSVCLRSIKSGFSFPLPILSMLTEVFWKHLWLRLPLILLKKLGTFSEICTKNPGHLEEKRDIFQKSDFPRRCCHSYRNKCLKLLHKILSQMCIHCVVMNTKRIQK
jgi:hypothetical protein